MSIYIRYPASGGGSSSNASVAPTGGAVPANATLVGGDFSGTLVAVKITAAGNLLVDGSTVTQPVSVASLPLPAGAATSALQTAGNASLVSIDSKLTSPLAVTGPLTDTQLRASAVPVSASALPLPSGAATSALQTSGNASLVSIDGKLTSPLAVTGTFFQATQPVSAAALPLPAGASTSALQTTGNTSLASIDTKLTAPLAVNAKAATPTAGTITQAAIAVGTTAVRLTVSGSAPSATRSVLVATPDSASTAKFYIGSASVTNSGATRGIQLVGGQSFTANSDAGDYYVISDTAAQTLYVLEQA